MKKTYLFLITVLSGYQFAYAQWNPGTGIITTTNNVGIGTTSPVSPLDVVGSWGAFSATAHVISQFVQDHTNNRGIYLGYDNSGQIGVIASNSAGAASNLAFWNYNSSGWFEGMRLTSAGNVGIATSNPNATLQVNGAVISNGGPSNLDPAHPSVNANTLAGTGQMLMGWNRTAGAGEADFIGNQGGGSQGGFAFYNHDNNNNETQLMWILGNGNVLIGKPSQANPIYKLDVKGYVRADQIVVNTSGADFVFDPVYKLHSLSFVKNYIEQNHHLPEIPSAKEMQTEGLNIGENQIKLLQKVEELTLYTIASDKEIKDEKAVIKAQQAQIDLLINQVAKLSNEKTK